MTSALQLFTPFSQRLAARRAHGSKISPHTIRNGVTGHPAPYGAVRHASSSSQWRLPIGAVQRLAHLAQQGFVTGHSVLTLQDVVAFKQFYQLASPFTGLSLAVTAVLVGNSLGQSLIDCASVEIADHGSALPKEYFDTSRQHVVASLCTVLGLRQGAVKNLDGFALRAARIGYFIGHISLKSLLFGCRLPIDGEKNVHPIRASLPCVGGANPHPVCPKYRTGSSRGQGGKQTICSALCGHGQGRRQSQADTQPACAQQAARQPTGKLINRSIRFTGMRGEPGALSAAVAALHQMPRQIAELAHRCEYISTYSSLDESVRRQLVKYGPDRAAQTHVFRHSLCQAGRGAVGRTPRRRGRAEGSHALKIWWEIGTRVGGIGGATGRLCGATYKSVGLPWL